MQLSCYNAHTCVGALLTGGSKRQKKVNSECRIGATAAEHMRGACVGGDEAIASAVAFTCNVPQLDNTTFGGQHVAFSEASFTTEDQTVVQDFFLELFAYAFLTHLPTTKHDMLDHTIGEAEKTHYDKHRWYMRMELLQVIDPEFTQFLVPLLDGLGFTHETSFCLALADRAPGDDETPSVAGQAMHTDPRACMGPTKEKMAMQLCRPDVVEMLATVGGIADFHVCNTRRASMHDYQAKNGSPCVGGMAHLLRTVGQVSALTDMAS